MILSFLCFAGDDKLLPAIAIASYYAICRWKRLLPYEYT